ncbi:hypothetical protein ACLOJK_025741 [Asimina triloba]
MAFKTKKRLRSSRKKYLKPGALAQLRYSKATLRSFTDVEKKSILVLDSGNQENVLQQDKGGNFISPLLSPKRTGFPPMVGSHDGIKLLKLPGTPSTPRTIGYDHDSDSRLESLPMDLLVNIICHLHHDQLKAVFHVSQRIRKAVLIARQCHFNYTTPDRSRQELLKLKTPLPTERWPFISKGDGKGSWNSIPHTPKAPKHGPRPLSRLNLMNTRHIAASLFEESTVPSSIFSAEGLLSPSALDIAADHFD